jgi:hypothetical protein
MALDDLDDYFDPDESVIVVANGITSKGLREEETQIVINGEIQVVDDLLIVRTDLFGGLKIGDVAMVDDVMCRVKYDPMKFDDGKFCRLPLSAPKPATGTVVIGFPLATTVGIPLVAVPRV